MNGQKRGQKISIYIQEANINRATSLAAPRPSRRKHGTHTTRQTAGRQGQQRLDDTLKEELRE